MAQNYQKMYYDKAKDHSVDFYQTPKEFVEVLRRELSFPTWNKKLYGKRDTYLATTKSVLDPCCGLKVIGNCLRQTTNNIIESDLFFGEDKEDFLSLPTPEIKFDFIVMNPPYSLKVEFILRALLFAKDIFVLLPLAHCNYKVTNEKLFDTPNYMGKILMYPACMLDEKGFKKLGGHSVYCWHHFTSSPPRNNDIKYTLIRDWRKYGGEI